MMSPALIPVLKRLVRISRYNSSMWKGDYADWATVKRQCDGYESGDILQKCREALHKVKAGEAQYERDSLLFNDTRLCWELLAAALKTASEQGRLSVLDFGGALGSLYFQHRTWLNQVPNLRWHVVEQENFVQAGRAEAEDGRLRFFHSIEDSQASDKANLILLSGVIQVMEDPYAWIRRFNALPEVAYIVLDRVPIIKDGRTKDMLTRQTVAPHIYQASYPSWFFHEPNFLKAFDRYEMVAEYQSRFDWNQWVNGLRCTWKGYVLAPKPAVRQSSSLF
ncbi:MAG: methyltransferase, TIGR04325 family [Saprospiraceae bacterium]|nr:methyltransferase, TIGR04325 family [Saprospiraceae bacterium]